MSKRHPRPGRPGSLTLMNTRSAFRPRCKTGMVASLLAMATIRAAGSTAICAADSYGRPARSCAARRMRRWPPSLRQAAQRRSTDCRVTESTSSVPPMRRRCRATSSTMTTASVIRMRAARSAMSRSIAAVRARGLGNCRRQDHLRDLRRALSRAIRRVHRRANRSPRLSPWVRRTAISEISAASVASGRVPTSSRSDRGPILRRRFVQSARSSIKTEFGAVPMGRCRGRTASVARHAPMDRRFLVICGTVGSDSSRWVRAAITRRRFAGTIQHLFRCRVPPASAALAPIAGNVRSRRMRAAGRLKMFNPRRFRWPKTRYGATGPVRPRASPRVGIGAMTVPVIPPAQFAPSGSSHGRFVFAV